MVARVTAAARSRRPTSGVHQRTAKVRHQPVSERSGATCLLAARWVRARTPTRTRTRTPNVGDQAHPPLPPPTRTRTRTPNPNLGDQAHPSPRAESVGWAHQVRQPYLTLTLTPTQSLTLTPTQPNPIPDPKPSPTLNPDPNSIPNPSLGPASPPHPNPARPDPSLALRGWLANVGG